jgi:hypothetical protein
MNRLGCAGLTTAFAAAHAAAAAQTRHLAQALPMLRLMVNEPHFPLQQQVDYELQKRQKKRQ